MLLNGERALGRELELPHQQVLQDAHGFSR